MRTLHPQLCVSMQCSSARGSNGCNGFIMHLWPKYLPRPLYLSIRHVSLLFIPKPLTAGILFFCLLYCVLSAFFSTYLYLSFLFWCFSRLLFFHRHLFILWATAADLPRQPAGWSAMAPRDTETKGLSAQPHCGQTHTDGLDSWRVQPLGRQTGE